MNIVIVGSGAMGLLFHSQLSTAHNVSLCTRTENQKGNEISVTALDGSVQKHTYINTQKADIERADCIIFCVKCFDIIAAIKHLLTNITANSKIVIMHNGMGVVEEIVQQINIKNPIYTLLTTQASRKTAAFEITHTGAGNSQLGLAINNDSNEQQAILANSLSNLIPNITLTTTIKQQQWQKLAINCAINALTAINNVSNGDIAQQQFRELLVQIIAEVITVAKAENIYLDNNVILDSVLLVIEKTKNNSSSMREDVRNCRATEINYINGYIKQLGQKYNIPTPVNSMLYQQIQALQQNYSN
ncbi:ketopantoate reductase family protein [Colwelliaceae bacterium BS250]